MIISFNDNIKIHMFLESEKLNLGKLVSPDSNEFPENFIAIFFANSLPKLPFLMQKNCNEIFWIGNDTPPPFRKFSGNSFESGDTGFPYRVRK